MKGWAVFAGLILLSISLLFFLSSCSVAKDFIETGNITLGSSEPQENITVEVHNERVLFIIAQNSFRDEELAKPKQILRNAGYSYDVASITTEHAIGMMGSVVKPDMAVKDANASNYALIVVVGGSGAPALAENPDVLALLAMAKNDSKLVGGICLGPMVLAKAGVLNGRRATVFQTPESLAALQEGNASFVDEKVVVDDWLVTANGPGASDEFGNALVKLLKDKII